jgi:6-phosphogluconolactonase
VLRANEKLLVLPHPASAAHTAAEQVMRILFSGAACSAERAPRTVALAGGKTPAAMYRLLSEPPFRSAGDWTRIDWFWGDERCVPPDHPDSNYRMAMEALLTPLAVPPERIHRMPADAADLDAAAREYEHTIRRIAGPGVPDRATHSGAASAPELDLVLLGIGSDGHTASLFPGSEGLNERRRLVIAHHAPGPDAMRMTMTYPLLWNARHVLLLATGADKADAIRRSLTQPPDTAPPAARLREARGHILWILDAAACW